MSNIYQSVLKNPPPTKQTHPKQITQIPTSPNMLQHISKVYQTFPNTFQHFFALFQTILVYSQMAEYAVKMIKPKEVDPSWAQFAADDFTIDKMPLGSKRKGKPRLHSNTGSADFKCR